jgi:hypothetical protein
MKGRRVTAWQLEETPCVGRDACAEGVARYSARGSEPRYGVRDPRRLISLAAVRHRREIGRVRFHENTIVGYHAKHVVVLPIPEGDHTTEGDIPPGIERGPGERGTAGEAMQHATHAKARRVREKGARIFLGIACMDDKRKTEAARDIELPLEDGSLRLSRRVVIVIIEAALTDGTSSVTEKLLEYRLVTLSVDSCRVVRMQSGGKGNEARVRRGDQSRPRRSRERLTDADDAAGAGDSRPLDHRLTIDIEGAIGEVSVTVDELHQEKKRTASAAVLREVLMITARDQRLATALS